MLEEKCFTPEEVEANIRRGFKLSGDEREKFVHVHVSELFTYHGN